MITLYLKIHPSYIAFVASTTEVRKPVIKDFKTIPVSNDLIITTNLFEREVQSLIENAEMVLIEKPYLKLKGNDQRKLAQEIIRIQRITGALQYSLYSMNPDIKFDFISARDVKESIYGRYTLSKDTQITEAAALLGINNNSALSALELLCLHDCLCLKAYNERRIS